MSHVSVCPEEYSHISELRGLISTGNKAEAMKRVISLTGQVYGCQKTTLIS
jgi:hypothetical protein